MITNETHERMLSQYQKLKELVYDNFLTKEEFIYHIENKTKLGEEINNTIISLSTANDYEKNLTDFINLLFN